MEEVVSSSLKEPPLLAVEGGVFASVAFLSSTRLVWYSDGL